MPDDQIPEAYVPAHLAESLATDPRVGELGITVTLDGSTLVLEGIVPTPERREAAETVIRERAPEFEVENRIEVEALDPGGEPEVVA